MHAKIMRGLLLFIVLDGAHAALNLILWPVIGRTFGYDPIMSGMVLWWVGMYFLADIFQKTLCRNRHN